MKKGKKYVGLFVLLFVLAAVTIGYSYLSATLEINGTSKIKASEWDVHFNNIQVTGDSVTATTDPTISANGLNISYAVELQNPGDFYEFTVDVVNGGSVNAALADFPVLGGVTDEQDVYTNFTFTHVDGTPITDLDDEIIAANETKTYTVRVEYDREIDTDQLPDSEQNMTLTVGMDYEQE